LHRHCVFCLSSCLLLKQTHTQHLNNTRTHARTHYREQHTYIRTVSLSLLQARPEQVKLQLLSEGLELEEYGGDVQCVETAARTGGGLLALEEALLLQAEVMELRAPADAAAAGVVVEAKVCCGFRRVEKSCLQGRPCYRCCCCCCCFAGSQPATPFFTLLLGKV
jgi:hypothetical protein